MSQTTPRKAVVLVSGGMDSAVTIAIAREQGYQVHALSVAYGQRHSAELAASERVSHLLGAVEHKTVQVDLRTIGGAIDPREPGREIRLHLTGHMQRYIWSFDGQKFSESQPLRFNYGERLRVVLINDSMMNHPIHLHGMWSEVESPDGEFLFRKHTVVIQPGQQLSYRVTANAPGRWAFHCHLLYHMEAGMFREVVVEGGPQ